MTRGLASALLVVTTMAAPACRPRATGESEASAKYRAAWDKRRAGDEAGYQAAMKQIAAQWPQTRAGRRAREVAASAASGGQGTMMGAAMAGVMAAVAVPAFMKYRAQGGTVSGPVGLSALPLAPRVDAEPTVGHVPRGHPASEKKGWEPLAAPSRKR